MISIVVMIGGVAFLAFAWGVRFLFRREAGVARAMTWLTIISTVFAIADLVSLALSPAAAWRVASAGVLYLASIALFAWAAATIRHNPFELAFGEVVPNQLVRRGPYEHVRHPLYTAYLIAWAAGAVGSTSHVPILALGAMAVFYVRAAALEERWFAVGDLGSEYAGYRRVTGRFLPRLDWRTTREARHQ